MKNDIDIVGHKLNIGDSILIIKCDKWPNLVGKQAIVMRSDCDTKVRVSHSDQWQGYFYPNQIVKI